MNLDVVTVGKSCFEIFVSGRDIRPGIVDRDANLVLSDKNTYQAEHSVYEVGGSALVSAMTFARQGIKTGCITRTGRDLLSNEIKQVQKKEGISTEYNIGIPEHHTDMNFHIITERSSDIKIKYDNSYRAMTPKDFKFPNLSMRFLYFAGLPQDYRAFKYLASWAKTHGAETFLNVTSAHGYKNRQINYVLSSVENIMMPLSFATKLFNEVHDPRELIRQLLAFGAKTVLLYDVKEEAYACIDKTIYSCGTYKSINPLDLTGANDAFASAYVSALIQNRSAVEALTLASANACSVMEVFGSRAGILKKPALRSMQVSIGDI